LDAFDSFDDVDFLPCALSVVKSNHLESITDVVVHFCDYAQPAGNVSSALILANGEDVHQCASHQTDQEIGEYDEIPTRNAIAMESQIEYIAAEGDHH
jgi:hypothetical protein